MEGKAIARRDLPGSRLKRSPIKLEREFISWEIVQRRLAATQHGTTVEPALFYHPRHRRVQGYRDWTPEPRSFLLSQGEGDYKIWFLLPFPLIFCYSGLPRVLADSSRRQARSDKVFRNNVRDTLSGLATRKCHRANQTRWSWPRVQKADALAKLFELRRPDSATNDGPGEAA